jgi:hypothetical protein
MCGWSFYRDMGLWLAPFSQAGRQDFLFPFYNLHVESQRRYSSMEANTVTVLLLGDVGCGKTTFLSYAHRTGSATGPR